MKRPLALALCALLLTGCASQSTIAETTLPPQTQISEAAPEYHLPEVEEIPAPEYVSRYDTEVVIAVSDSGIAVNGAALEENSTAQSGVYLSRDIIYYEDKDAYESGYPYGEGEASDRHTQEEAAAHVVINITAPGTYRIQGALSAGQIRVDLGDDARENPDARVELILDGADITCTVAPAVLFLNVYECDGNWSVDTATADVDTSEAGATLVIQGQNRVSGSHVARIYKDTEGEKKLWKQDGAVYSYMSMNVYGPGKLDLYADNEGLDTELHLTINGGDIAIRADNDGINTNEDGVSVTTINGGSLHIIAGLGAEGDGIDSNGYLVINGGTVVASANPAGDAGLDSDLGSYINGGTVIALGSTMDWAESDSEQVTMNLQFSSYQSSGSAVVVTAQDGTVIFAYDPSEDEVLGENVRQYMGAILSCPYFVQGEGYQVYLDGVVCGKDSGGVYDVTTVTGYEGGSQQGYSATDVTMMPGMGGGMGGGMPGDMGGERPAMPEGEAPAFPEGQMPTMPEDQMPAMTEGVPPEMGENGEIPENAGIFRPDGGWGQQSFGGEAGNTLFYMQDKVNCFSGVAAAQ